MYLSYFSVKTWPFITFVLFSLIFLFYILAVLIDVVILNLVDQFPNVADYYAHKFIIQLGNKLLCCVLQKAILPYYHLLWTPLLSGKACQTMKITTKSTLLRSSPLHSSGFAANLFFFLLIPTVSSHKTLLHFIISFSSFNLGFTHWYWWTWGCLFNYALLCNSIKNYKKYLEKIVFSKIRTYDLSIKTEYLATGQHNK